MDIITIDTATSYDALAMLRIFAKSGVSFKKAILNVKGMPTESTDSKKWPLIFDCYSDESECKKFQIRIHTLTCGYHGTGPTDLMKCLSVAGFGNIVDKEEIFNKKEIKREYQK